MKRMSALAGAALLVTVGLLAAQQPPPPSGRPPMAQGQPNPGQPGPDPLAGSFFPPELIMQHQEALGLTEEQRGYLIGEIQRVQGQATAIQWRLQQRMERLGGLVRQPKPDEAQVLAQLDSVLAIEREMKRLQMGLMVRLKSRLSAEQQAFLRERMGRPREEP